MREFLGGRWGMASELSGTFDSKADEEGVAMLGS